MFLKSVRRRGQNARHRGLATSHQQGPSILPAARLNRSPCLAVQPHGVLDRVALMIEVMPSSHFSSCEVFVAPCGVLDFYQTDGRPRIEY